MITEIDFQVKGEERKKLAYAIGELLGMSVKYTRTPKFDYLIGSCILDKNGVFHASGDLSESKLDLILERFYKGEPIQQSELPEYETVEADVLSISVPRNMFTDDKLENLQKLIEGKQTLFKHAFRAEQLEVVITQNQVSFLCFPLASEPDNYTPHSMRHTTATHMLEAGVPLIVVKNFLGHVSLQTTQIYTEITQDTMNKQIRSWNDKWFLKDNSRFENTNGKSNIPEFLR